ncbi:MAG: carboxypeptidase-like regulatory domain-containing protein [Crocinitomicaceae bacterium]
MKQTFLLLLLVLVFAACKKIEGPGGTSAIRGQLTGQDYSFGDKEVTTISFSSCATLEHGDYWLLNSTDSSKLYYIYYQNPSWISSADPQLQGRIGIAVSFNYSDSNIEIAQRTLDSINQQNDLPFELSLTQDILTVTSKFSGEVVDADDYTTPFSVDISNQGSPNMLGDTFGRADERVYIIYGDNTYSANSVRTDEEGKFSFEGLQTGTYTIYAISEDTIQNGKFNRISKTIEITEKKQIVDGGVFNVFY